MPAKRGFGGSLRAIRPPSLELRLNDPAIVVIVVRRQFAATGLDGAHLAEVLAGADVDAATGAMRLELAGQGIDGGLKRRAGRLVVVVMVLVGMSVLVVHLWGSLARVTGDVLGVYPVGAALSRRRRRGAR
jgi:hypothetical protein